MGNILGYTPFSSRLKKEFLMLRQIKIGVTLTSPDGARGSSSAMTHEEIQHLVDKRTLARHAKEFAASDKIRKKLADAGVVLEDKPDGTTSWRTM